MGNDHQPSRPLPLLPMYAISVGAWALYAIFYRTFWPGSEAVTATLGVFAIWFVISSAVFIAATYLVILWFAVPGAWRGSAAAALSAPALCLDMLAVANFDIWFPHAAAGDAPSYAALVLGGVGAILFAGLLMTNRRL
ncbi:MAG: hypothetical protein Tsb002_25780 [Wenzhouxiangellaceae bacterium]